MRIQIAEIEGPITATGKNNRPYKVVNIKYFSNGKTYEKKLTQFSDAYPVLSAAMPDQLFSVDLEKNGQFTEWKNVQPVDVEAVTHAIQEEAKVEAEAKKGPGRPAGAKNKVQSASAIPDQRETREERAARQELIVRQSSVSNAIEFFKMRQQGLPDNVSTSVTEEDVVEVAKYFRNYVYAGQEVTVSSEDTVE